MEIPNNMSTRHIRRIIRQVLREATREDVETSNDPLDWVTAAYQDPMDWGEDDPFIAMKKAAAEFGLKQLGAGTSRTVYELGSSKVLKVANDVKGLKQNELELTAGRDPTAERILAGVLNSADDFSWVVSEKVTPLDPDGFTTAERMIGVSWNDVREVIGLRRLPDMDMDATGVAPAFAGRGGSGNVSGGGGPNCLKGQEFLDYLKGFLQRYSGMLKGDVAKLDSWGITRDRCLVLLDYGITKKNFDALYKTPPTP